MTELPLEADEKLVQIYNRALAAKIPCAWYAHGIKSPGLKLRLPDGAVGLVVDVRPEDAERFAQEPFENIVLLGKYLAHWNKERREIVALVKRSSMSVQFSEIPGFEKSPEKETDALADDGFLGKLGDLGKIEGLGKLRDMGKMFTSRNEGVLSLKNSDENIAITLQMPPVEEVFFCGETGIGGSVSLKIAGVELDDAKAAIKFLFDISYALFYELDVNYSTTMQLCLRVDKVPFRSERRKTISPNVPSFPELRFPRDAIELYMHARTINTAPLTEYLTYYQVIEHCMAAFSVPDVIHRLRERLADPSFDVDDDVALSELLMQPRRGGQSNPAEREQIRAAISACVTGESIEDLLNSDKSLAEFVSEKSNSLAGRPIAVQGGNTKLPSQLADRIYDLRCRIVHAKGNAFDVAGSPLLPFNADADLLRHDLLLVRFAAQKVLLTVATTL